MKKESGRSLVEMLAVLAVVAIILLASLFTFQNLFKSYQRRETVKEMNTLVTRFKTTALSKMKKGEMSTKDKKRLMPESTFKGGKIQTANGGTLDFGMSGSTFVVISSNLNLSCNDFVSEGNYDAVSYGNSDTIPTTLPKLYSKDDVKTIETLKTICNSPYQYFLYGQSDSGDGKYFVEGELSECPEKDQVKGKDGQCCSKAEYDAKCGYCDKTCGGEGQCVDGVCSECKTDSDCKNNPAHAEDKKFYCVNTVCKQCKEVGAECDETNWPGDYMCDSKYECISCDSKFKEWNGFTCICKSTTHALNEECSAECGCADGLTCYNGVCIQDGSEKCSANAEYKAKGLTCLNEETDECVCCGAAKLDADGKCVDCSERTDGRTRFDEITKQCVCLEGYVFNAETSKCEPDPNCAQGCGGFLAKGADCTGSKSCCCGQGLECKNGTCQCSVIPQQKGAECGTTCGCKTETGLVCVAQSGSIQTTCQCPADKPEWDAVQGKCVECLTTKNCEGNTYCDTTEKVCKKCSTTPKPTCSISEDETDAKGCVLKTPFTCPGENDDAKNLFCVDETTCKECTSNLHCPENTFCNENNQCQACGPDTSAPYVKSIREKESTGRCGCPTGYNIYCRSTSAGGNSSCVEGNYICRAGCQQTSDCDPNEYCNKTSTATLGECKPCPTGQYRNEGETECHTCSGCQVYDETLKQCVSTCQNDEVCLMNSCTATANANGTCAVTANPNTSSCMKKPTLKEITGASTAGGHFYLPPADSQYLMSQPDAARFCESYGLRLANVQQACGKDWAYDSGYDCANISAHNLYQYGNRNSGTFWMDARYGAQCTSLTITYSCGNNHESHVCNIKQYPICTDGSSKKCANNEECPENYYCTNDGCKPCGADGLGIRKANDDSCHCPDDKTAYCGGTGKWKTNCKDGDFICKAECYFDTQCGENEYCIKETGKEFGQCGACPTGQIRTTTDQACHGCTDNIQCPENRECIIEEGQTTGLCQKCHNGEKGYGREKSESECKYSLLKYEQDLYDNAEEDVKEFWNKL